jgi:hypothetical protein
VWLSDRAREREERPESAELHLVRGADFGIVHGGWWVPPELRVAAYDAMTPDERELRDGAFRAIAQEWLDAAAAQFAGADELPQASGWNHPVAAYNPVGGGLLLICW